MIIGIDPGKKGGMSFLTDDGKQIRCYDFSNMTLHDIVVMLDAYIIYAEDEGQEIFAYIEKVRAMKPAGKVANFGLGRSFGRIEGILASHKIPYEEVAPNKWQRALGCQSGGDKNITKAKAQQLFPNVEITHNIADSMLIAEYGRRDRLRDR